MLRSIVTAITLLLTLVVFAHAQTDDSIAGTHAVTFQPTQVGGTLVGCALVYRVVQFDHAYLGGQPIVAVGNIGIHQSGGTMALTLKVGVKPITGSSPFVSPTFAYLQTKSVSTAKVKQKAREVEKGFRYIVYSFFEPPVQQVINDMLESGKVTLAFNRKVNGMDVFVPIDFSVIDATYPGGNKVARVKSKETMNDFSVCYQKLLDQALVSLDKK